MSRARPITLPDGEEIWFDVSRNGQQASVEDLSLLASVEDIELDDLLDESLTRGDVLRRLRDALGQGQVPADVEMRRNAARVLRQQAPKCRICGVDGDSTKHHFVNRWIMRELSNYDEVGSRSKCTIPVCRACHIDLHDRNTPTYCIVPFLSEDERRFARDLIESLRREHPKVLELLLDGDGESVYEARLIQDWAAGRFDH